MPGEVQPICMVSDVLLEVTSNTAPPTTSRLCGPVEGAAAAAAAAGDAGDAEDAGEAGAELALD